MKLVALKHENGLGPPTITAPLTGSNLCAGVDDFVLERLPDFPLLSGGSARVRDNGSAVRGRWGRFDAIRDPTERARFMNLPTSFALPAEDVDGLRAVAGRLLRQSAEYESVVREFGGTPAQ